MEKFSYKPEIGKRTRKEQIVLLILSFMFISSLILGVISPILFVYVEPITVAKHFGICAFVALITGPIINRLNKRIYERNMKKEREKMEQELQNKNNDNRRKN